MRKIIAFIALSTILFGDFVDLNRATTIARNFHNSRSDTFSIESVESVNENNLSYLYIFKLDPVGFIIVSANDNTMPVLGYSFENNFNSVDLPVQVDYLFGVYKDDIDNVYELNLTPSDEISTLWDHYSNSFLYQPDRSVSPLLACNWNQDSPWNDMCPEDTNGPGGNVYSGCVAVSMVQIMYYWGYPEVGYGSHGYNAGGYGYQFADFGNSFYDYDDMQDNIATEASQLLMYHAGVSVNMGYSPNGSGASVMGGSNSTYSAMKNYFIFDHSIARIYPENYSTSQYREFLQSDLDSNQPIIYVGYSNEGGHAWNLDGYEDDYFHSNFGWGGSNNGYYLLSAMNGFNYSQGALINIIPEELDEPHITLMEAEYYEIEGDGDDVINPGEMVAYFVTIENFIPWNDATLVTIALESLSDDLIIENESIYVGDLNSGSEYTNNTPFQISVPIDAELGNHSMLLHIMGDDGNYLNQFEVTLNVSLFQSGFPYDTFDQIKTNPLVLDLDQDNDNDIIFSDNMGFIHVVESDGSVTNSNFPYEIGDDVWGSPSAEDIDLDGDIEFIFTSKTKYIYIFDQNGLESSYYADKYILGTPVIGQIDSDPYYEIIVGGYGPGETSENELFVINHDCTDVDNFPLVVGEKIKSGVALADFNDNGLDDIVFGTDSGHLFIVYDSGAIANGFPVDLNDKIQSEPSILEYNNEKLIFVGSKDDNFYSVNSSGEIQFILETDGNIYTSPSFLESNQGLMIFFASDDGMIYAVDINGESFPGWPNNVGGGAIGSIIFGDVDGNGEHNIIASVNSEIRIFNQDGSDFAYSSILHELPLASAPTIIDLNNNGNLEVLVGTGTDLSSIDFKFESNNVSSWNMHRSNLRRTGFHLSISDMNLGDINQDLEVDILDVIIMINFAIGSTNPTSNEFYLSDINSDGQIDVLDVVILVNLILE